MTTRAVTGTASGTATGTATRVAVVGDVGGHLDELRAELARLGVEGDGPLPPDLCVVQVGDLVHRGPESDAVVELVDRYLGEQPEQWVQLVGNHELVYLQPHSFDWRERVHRRSARTLRQWWRSGAAGVAAAVEGAGESYLVTHAGVTRPFWRDVLDSPPTAGAAAARINELARRGDGRVFRAGVLVAGGGPDHRAGPLWADAGTELVPSWEGHPLPFSQVHGHSAVTDWSAVPAEEAARESPWPLLHRDHAAKHEMVGCPGGRLIGIDPGHLRTATSTWSALVLPGATCSAPA